MPHSFHELSERADDSLSIMESQIDQIRSERRQSLEHKFDLEFLEQISQPLENNESQKNAKFCYSSHEDAS
jgi:hypothetical protein